MAIDALIVGYLTATGLCIWGVADFSAGSECCRSHRQGGFGLLTTIAHMAILIVNVCFKRFLSGEAQVAFRDADLLVAVCLAWP